MGKTWRGSGWCVVGGRGRGRSCAGQRIVELKDSTKSDEIECGDVGWMNLLHAREAIRHVKT